MKAERKSPAAIAIAILLCVAAGTTIGCQSKQSRFEEHLARAEEYSAEGKYAEATIELRNALGLEPANAEVNWRLAQLMRRQGKSADELFYYGETARLDPTRTDAILLQASLLYGDEPERARTLIEDVLQREPQNADAHLRASELALVDEDVDEALAQAMTAAELEPGKGIYQQQIGIVYRAQIRSLRFQQGKEPEPAAFERAVAAFERANEIDGPSWQYEIEKARVYRGWFGHALETEKSYRRALDLAIEAKDPAAATLVAPEIQRYAGDARKPALGRWVAERITDVDPTQVPAWLQLASLAETTGGDPEAVYRRMLEANPKALAAHVGYARWLVSRQRAQEAYEHLAKAREAGVDEAELLGATANLQLMAGAMADAKATVETLEREFPDHPRTRLSRIQIAVVEGRHADVASAFQNSDALQDNPEALRMLAFSQVALGNLPAAADAIGRAIALTPSPDPTFLRLQAEIQHRQRDFAGALVTYGKLTELQAALAPADELRVVQALYETGDAEGARKRLEAAIGSESAIPELSLEYAFREGERQPERVTAVLEEAAKRFPADPRPVTYLAQLDVRAGQPERALARLDEAAAAEPTPPLLLFTRAQILASKRDWVGAEADLGRVLALAPTFPGAADLLVQVYQAQGRIEDAIQKLEEVAGTNAARPESDYLLGRLYFSSGATDKALPHYERAIAAAPQNAEAKNDLAFLLAQQGQDLARALTLAQEAQQMRPQSPAVTDTLGYVYLQRGLYEPAREQFAAAIALAEASGAPRPEYHVHLAEAHRGAGRMEDANAEIRKALELDPDHPEALAAAKQLEMARSAAPPAAATP